MGAGTGQAAQLGVGELTGGDAGFQDPQPPAGNVAYAVRSLGLPPAPAESDLSPAVAPTGGDEPGDLNPPVAGSPPLKLAIITRPEFVDSLRPLATWKTQRGVPTALYTTAWIYSHYSGADHAVGIKNFLHDLRTQYRLEYVILGGDVAVVPSRQAVEPPSRAVDLPLYTDYFYTNLSDWDANHNGFYGEIADNLTFTNDLAVGRLPTRDPQQMAAVVAKLLAYEQNPPAGDWFNRAVVLGGMVEYQAEDNGKRFPDRADGATPMEYVANRLLPAAMQVTRLYEAGGVSPSRHKATAALTRENVTRALSQGASILASASHGSETGLVSEQWVTDLDGDGFRDTDSKENQWPSTHGNEFLSKADVPGLKNGVRAPLAYLLACETSSPIYTPGSFAASLVLQPDGGAITVIGATRPTWTVTDWDPAANNNLDPALATRFWQLFFDPAQGNFRAGLALNRAKDWYAAQFRPSLDQVARSCPVSATALSSASPTVPMEPARLLQPTAEDQRPEALTMAEWVRAIGGAVPWCRNDLRLALSMAAEN